MPAIEKHSALQRKFTRDGFFRHYYRKLTFSMDLRSHYPYWLLHHGLPVNFPSLSGNISTEVAVIGAGISGALTAWYLCKAGFRVTIVDRRHAGTGSTVASTALLQYEIDEPLLALTKKVGEKNAVRSYLLCRDAIYKLKTICTALNDKAIFKSKPSFQFASFKNDVKDLYKEFHLRKQNGIAVRWLEAEEIKEKFGLIKPAGILSRDGAEADAYMITQLLLKKLQRLGAQVYDHTEICKIRTHTKSVELVTAADKKIKARWLVIACGYESQQYLPQKIERLQSTYAIASEPMQQDKFWYKNALIWETARPYTYLRTTPDNRLLIGGKDSPFSNPVKRDKVLAAKRKQLQKAFADLFPSIPFKTDFSWAGTFSSTKDGLPYIGAIPQRPHTYFSLGFGGNGTTFSVIAAEIIRDCLLGRKNPDKEIFSFQR